MSESGDAIQRLKRPLDKITREYLEAESDYDLGMVYGQICGIRTALEMLNGIVCAEVIWIYEFWAKLEALRRFVKANPRATR